MSYYTHTVNPIGNFIEKDHGNNFEYSLNDDAANNLDTSLAGGIRIGQLATVAAFSKYPHKVWVSNLYNQGYRYAIVKKTVAYVVVDEDEFGLPVLEKWNIKNNKEYMV